MTRPTISVGVAVAVFAGSLVTAVLHADDREVSSIDARAKIGLAYARQQGIDLNLSGRDPETLGLGSYLVNAVGGCNDCHTAPSYTKDPFAFLGAPKQVNVACYLAGGQTFGPFVSRDITPFKNGKPAGLSFGAFLHVIRTGEDPINPGQVLQVMPWPTYQTMTDADLHAIYVYLSSIPAIAADICGVPSE
jgi:hypothetical protein